MINLNTGDITLFHSQFLINRFLTSEDIEKGVPELIVQKNNFRSDYSEFCLWGNFEKNQYIYFTLQFHPKNQLRRICIYPQHHGFLGAPQPNSSKCSADWLEVKRWYHKYFQQKNEYADYPWGEFRFIKGSDDIYFPTKIDIRYK